MYYVESNLILHLVSAKNCSNKEKTHNMCTKQRKEKQKRKIREKRELDQGIIESEVRRFNEKMRHYDNNPVGSMTDDKESGKIRVILVN